MYNIPYFRETDRQVVLNFMKQHPFAFIAGSSASGSPVATQLPLLTDVADGNVVLTGHMMIHSDHYRAFRENPQVLCVFTGPHCYVSATWYTNPHQASTWNYLSVHAKGQIRFLDADALPDVMRRITLHFENGDAHSTTVFDNLPIEYRQPLMKAITAFEIHVQSLENVFKLSQNRDIGSYRNIISQLSAGTPMQQEVAAEMKKREKMMEEQTGGNNNRQIS